MEGLRPCGGVFPLVFPVLNPLEVWANAIRQWRKMAIGVRQYFAFDSAAAAVEHVASFGC